jgi:hypothetical protein
VKRQKPLKRGSKRLERRTELRADVDKVREFLRRAKPLERTGGMRRATAAEGPLTPAAWRQAVHDLSGGRCIITGALARNAADRRFDPHHPLAKRLLRDRGLLDHVWDARNGIWITRAIHAAHEHPGVRDSRIPARALPRSVWEFCAELDALDGTGWATAAVLRAHPPTGSSRAS